MAESTNLKDSLIIYNSNPDKYLKIQVFFTSKSTYLLISISIFYQYILIQNRKLHLGDQYCAPGHSKRKKNISISFRDFILKNGKIKLC